MPWWGNQEQWYALLSHQSAPSSRPAFLAAPGCSGVFFHLVSKSVFWNRWCGVITKYKVLNLSWHLRDDRMDHFGWIFGKLPNGFGKLCCAFLQQTFWIGATPPLFPKIHCFYPSKLPQKPQRNFGFWIGNDPPPPSEVFRKFIPNGPCDRP